MQVCKFYKLIFHYLILKSKGNDIVTYQMVNWHTYLLQDFHINIIWKSFLRDGIDNPEERLCIGLCRVPVDSNQYVFVSYTN